MEGDKNLIELSKLCCGGVAAFGEVVVGRVVGDPKTWKEQSFTPGAQGERNATTATTQNTITT